MLFHESEKSVIMLEEISSSRADTEWLSGAAGTDIANSHRLFCSPEEKVKVVMKTGEKCLGRVLEQLLFGDGGISDEEATR